MSVKQLLLALILCFAAFLRLYRIDVLMRFIWDEGRDMLAIRNIIVNHDLTLFGPFNEIGGHIDFFGVFHYYLMLPALWLTDLDPVGPAIWTAILGVFAVGLTFIWARKWLDWKSSFAITALMAVSPLVVKYNQWPWNPNTTGFFGILYLISLQYWQKKPHLWVSIISGLLLGLLFQLHYFTIALGAAAVIVFLWQKQLSWKRKFIHSLLFLIGWLTPNLTFVLFDITHEGFYRKIVFQSFVGNTSQRFFTVDFWHIITTPLQYLFKISSEFTGNTIVGILVTLLLLMWIIRSLRYGLKTHEANEEIQLSVSWITFLLITSFFPTLTDNYHSASLWLSIAVAIIVILKPIWSQLSSNLQKLLLGGCILFLIWNNQLWRQPTWQENMPAVRSAAYAISQDVQNKKNVNVASFVDADTRATRFRYFLIQKNTPVLGIDDYPYSTHLYVISPNSWEKTKENPAWELESFREYSAELVWRNENWQVYRVSKKTM